MFFPLACGFCIALTLSAMRIHFGAGTVPVILYPDGTVQPTSGPANGAQLNLDGISFRCGPPGGTAARSQPGWE